MIIELNECPEIYLGIIRLTTHIYLNDQHVVLVMTSTTKMIVHAWEWCFLLVFNLPIILIHRLQFSEYIWIFGKYFKLPFEFVILGECNLLILPKFIIGWQYLKLDGKCSSEHFEPFNIICGIILDEIRISKVAFQFCHF